MNTHDKIVKCRSCGYVGPCDPTCCERPDYDGATAEEAWQAAIEADRKRRGEPSSLAEVWRINADEAEAYGQSDRADTLRECAAEVEKLAAPQPAEPEPCFCDRMYPDSNPDASCGDCPTRDYMKPAESVRKTDWNNELSSWSDEDFIHIFHERPDLANRLRKMLAEPMCDTLKEMQRFSGKWPTHEFAIVIDRFYEGEGPSLAMWNGESYQFSDGDHQFYRDEDDSLGGYTVEWLTHGELERRLFGSVPLTQEPVAYLCRECDEEGWSTYAVMPHEVPPTSEFLHVEPLYTAPQPLGERDISPKPVKHDLYKTGDKDAPEQIRDRNGEVVLDCCKRCGKFESQLSESCVADPVKVPSDKEIYGESDD